MFFSPRVIKIGIVAVAGLIASHGSSCAQQPACDTLRIRGDIGLTGLVQTGDETRTVLSLLSDLRIGNRQWQAEPISSIAYSTKPHKQVEGEYLENLTFRYHPLKKWYPALGVLAEHSLLRKIRFRDNAVAVLVWKIANATHRTLKFAPGIGYESVWYEAGSFQDMDSLHRRFGCWYGHLKGEQDWQRLRLQFDFFYEAAWKAVDGHRWYGIASLDYALGKIISVRASSIYSYEQVVAREVSHYNFRLTYGISVKL